MLEKWFFYILLIERVYKNNITFVKEELDTAKDPQLTLRIIEDWEEDQKTMNGLCYHNSVGV